MNMVPAYALGPGLVGLQVFTLCSHRRFPLFSIRPDLRVRAVGSGLCTVHVSLGSIFLAACVNCVPDGIPPGNNSPGAGTIRNSIDLPDRWV